MYDIAAAYRSPIYKKCMVLMRRSEVAWAQSWVGKLAEDAPLFLLHWKFGRGFGATVRLDLRQARSPPIHRRFQCCKVQIVENCI